MTRRALLPTGFALLVAALGMASMGCSPVAPYQRGKLAHPTMAVQADTTMGVGHLRAIDEGAIGGSEGAGSGCGCN